MEDRFLLTFSIVTKCDGHWIVAAVNGEPYHAIGPFPHRELAVKAEKDARGMILSLPGAEELKELQ